jgi:hypothetical protein
MPWEEVKKEKACDGRKLRSDSTQASLNHSIGRRARVFFGHGAFAEAQMKFRMREWGVDESLHAAFWKSNMKHVRNVMCGVTDP